MTGPNPRMASERLRKLLRLEIIRYGLVGVVNTAFGYGVFVALQLTLGAVTHYIVVLIVSNLIAIPQAYVLQRRLAFRFTGGWWAGLARFGTVYLGAFVVNLALLPLLHEAFGIPVIPAQAMALVLQVAITYAAHRFFTFRGRGGSSAHPGSGLESGDTATHFSLNHVAGDSQS